jgi:hypothetical protein
VRVRAGRDSLGSGFQDAVTYIPLSKKIVRISLAVEQFFMRDEYANHLAEMILS